MCLIISSTSMDTTHHGHHTMHTAQEQCQRRIGSSFAHFNRAVRIHHPAHPSVRVPMSEERRPHLRERYSISILSYPAPGPVMILQSGISGPKKSPFHGPKGNGAVGRYIPYGSVQPVKEDATHTESDEWPVGLDGLRELRRCVGI